MSKRAKSTATVPRATYDRLRRKLQKVYEAGGWGIDYVGRANYAERQSEARVKLDKAMYP
jgi:hypothetical protein